MKYKFLLHFLQGLIYVKRFFWWIGSKFYLFFARFIGKIWNSSIYLRYKLNFFFRKLGWNGYGVSLVGRSTWQIVGFLILFFISLPHTKIYAKKNFGFPGQKTIINTLVGGEEQDLAEEMALSGTDTVLNNYSWKQRGVSTDFVSAPNLINKQYDYIGMIAGGGAVIKPSIMPGSSFFVLKRYEADEYVIEPGDSLGSIAQDYGVSIATILWENNLTSKSVIKPGQKIKIPPTSGVMHTVVKGDNLKKIATTYDAKIENIVAFNNLKVDGSNLKIGMRIMVPEGIKPEQRAVAQIKRTDSSIARIATPPSSREAPSVGGFVWPSGAHNITQYFKLGHPALDIAGPFHTPTYASKAGTVEKAACGWNSGYGCVIIIDHGGGIKTLYGHHDKLLVSPGDYVETGQTIGLMGNTGRVYGRTGIHVHFEVRVNGARVNPLGYVK